MKTVVRMKFGSTLYGTQTPKSDVDYAAVHIPDVKDILLGTAKGCVSQKRTKAHGERNKPGEIDEESYSLVRFMQLLGEGQTVALDMLFAPDEVILETSPLWQHLQLYRSQFLCKKSATFIGYCRRQANKYGIKGSRVATVRSACALLKALMTEDNMSKLSAHAQRLKEFVANTPEHTSFEEIPSVHGPAMHWEVCGRKLPFGIRVTEGYKILKRVLDNYGQRAEEAENNENIDWKALSHAVRVGREAIELLDTGIITLPLSYAPHLVRIKTGQYPYQDVSAEIEELLVKVEKAAEKSRLPDEPNFKFMEYIVLEAYKREVKNA